jgi:hypothetical protein
MRVTSQAAWLRTILVCVGLLWTISLQSARADENGISFWLPGQFGSLAAVPTMPGWSLGTVYYHTSVGGSGGVAASRQISTGKLPATVNVSLNASLNAQADILILAPTYTFATPVLGGQLAVGLTGTFARSAVGIDGTLTTNVGPFGTTRTGSLSDTLVSVGDLYPVMSLKWHNIDFHFDWGASKFLSKHAFVGLVGYVYQQVSDDSGQHPVLGAFRSRVLGIGPQFGYLFPVGDMQGYLNVKAYGEFDAANRPSGWNTWLTFSISPEPPASTVTSTKHLVRK